ncbi:hypothetical protein [Nocardioides pakistanensis]
MSRYDYPRAARAMFDDAVDDVAAKLRRMADEVERAGDRLSAVDGHPVDSEPLRALVAVRVLDAIEQGTANLHLDSLVRRASEADLAPYADRGLEAAS